MRGWLFLTVFDFVNYAFQTVHKLNIPFAVKPWREELNICINCAEFGQLE